MPDVVHHSAFAGSPETITDAEVVDVDIDVDRKAFEAADQAKAAADAAPTPDPDELARAISRRRHELVNHMQELERVVRAKLDVRSRLVRGGERAALRAETALEQLVERVRERPLPYLVAGGAILWFLFGRRRHPRHPAYRYRY